MDTFTHALRFFLFVLSLERGASEHLFQHIYTQKKFVHPFINRTDDIVTLINETTPFVFSSPNKDICVLNLSTQEKMIPAGDVMPCSISDV